MSNVALEHGQMTTTVTVDLGARSYPIVVGKGVLSSLGEEMRARLGGRHAHLVTNPTISALYEDAATDALESAGFTVHRIEMPDGEKHKTLGTYSSVLDQMLATRPERSWPVVALGGGVVGDVAGFVAASLLRGVPFVQVPTTLLAQVDSSVGGKTGVNHPQGKNLIGAFYQPSLVWIDLETLATLPRRELLAGVAEVIKTAAIRDGELFALLESRLDDVLALDEAVMRSVVARCCRIKADVVGADERESGLRAILNFGHTLGHAIENSMGYGELLHGEAVAIGMAFAARLSAEHGVCAGGEVRRLVELIERAGLPVTIPAELSSRALAEAVAGDKKVRDGKVTFVLLGGIGSTHLRPIAVDDIERSLDALRTA